MRVRSPHGVGSVIGYNQFSKLCLVRLDAGGCDQWCSPSDVVELQDPKLPPLRVPPGARARNVQSGVLGTVVQYGPSMNGAALVYIKVDFGSCTWCDPGLWEAV